MFMFLQMHYRYLSDYIDLIYEKSFGLYAQAQGMCY